MNIMDFKGGNPTLVLEDYFLGNTYASGLFRDRFGSVKRQFSVVITGTWDGSVLQLDEDFLYDDGETEQRVWHVTKLEAGRYQGRTDDVIGTADGIACGNAFHWTYDFNLRVGNSTLQAAFDDWMFLQPGGFLLNQARVSKWGVTLGNLLISFSKTRFEQALEIEEPVARLVANTAA